MTGGPHLARFSRDVGYQELQLGTSKRRREFWGTKVERWLHKIFLLLALVLCLLRFAYLRADFPNHSPWMMDQAKFPDEGWWASAAVRHFLVGHWRVAGDYN